jgi:hypothetical protein
LTISDLQFETEGLFMDILEAELVVADANLQGDGQVDETNSQR